MGHLRPPRRTGGPRRERRELERLRELAGEMEGLPGRFDDHEEEIRALVALNQEFHGTIAEASRNRRLERLINRTVEIPLMFKAFFWYTPHERVISNHYHRQILEALEKGDAGRAEIIMREHVYEGRDFVIGALEEDLNG
jgi:DNA-binding GntR family transcriptional regulator